MKTYGFDYAFAISWNKINNGLKANGAGQGIDFDYHGTDSQTQTQISLSLSPEPFQIVDGGGNNLVHLQITFGQGSMELDGPVVNGSYDLSTVSLIVEVNLGWVESADGAPSLKGSGNNTNLIFAPSQSSDKSAAGYVSAVNLLDPNGQLTGNNGEPDTVAVGLLKQFGVQALIKNREKLAYIFANVMPSQAKADSWLVPSRWEYFNVANSGAAQKSLCFLCMLGGDDLPSSGASFDADNLDANYDTLILISQPVMFDKVFLPAVRASYPKATFGVSTNDEICTLTNSGNFTLGKVQASHYKLAVDDAGTGLDISASGGGSLKFFFGLGKLPNASYSWSTDSKNPLAFNDGKVSFSADPHPSINHSQTIHWYDWVLLAVTGITNAASLGEAIYHAIEGFSDASEEMGVGNINKMVTDTFGGDVLNLAKLIDWKLAGQELSLSTAGLNGPLYVRGNFA